VEEERADGFSCLSDGEDDYNDDSCKSDGSREDVRNVGLKTESRKLRRQHQRHLVAGARSDGYEVAAGRLGTENRSSRRRGAANSPQSSRNKRSRRFGSESADECDYEKRSGTHWKSTVCSIRAGAKSTTQRTRSSRHLGRKLSSPCQSDTERPEQVSTEAKCPLGFTSVSNNESCSKNDVKPDLSRQRDPVSDYGSYDFTCASAAESRIGFPARDRRESIRDVLVYPSTADCSKTDADNSSTFGVPVTCRSNNRFAATPALRELCSEPLFQPSRRVASDTDRPSAAFNNADATDSSPVSQSIVRRGQSNISADKAGGASQLSVSSDLRSAGTSVDRPATSFNSADIVDNPPPRSSSHDVSHPSTEAHHLEYRCPLDVCQRPSYLSSTCVECPRCLSHALCAACNTFHESAHVTDDCISPNLRGGDRLGGLDALNVIARPTRGLSLDVGLRGGDTGAIGNDGFTTACSDTNMDLHALINRVAAQPDDGGISTLGAGRQRSYTSPCRSTVSMRTRSLHFYTDCADCPDCCSTAVCGSCCSVHGPAEELTTMTPRCVKSRLERDQCGDDSATDASVQNVTAVSAAKETETGGTDGKESTAEADNVALRSRPVESPLAQSSRLSSRNLEALSVGKVQSAAGVGDEECWTTFEKATCGVLALSILFVFVAIYLQLSRRYFTLVHSSI